MTYRLYIQSNETEVIAKPWVELDLGDESPAMTYQVNNLAVLKDRNASYSQRIKLPRNNHNCSALGFVDVFDVTARNAYNPPPARLTCDDIRLSPDGAILSIEAVTPSTIEVQIKSGTFDFFKFLEALPMNSSEDGGTTPGFIVDWNMRDIPLHGIGTLPNGVPYRYLLATVDQNLDGKTQDAVSWIKSMQALYPHIPLVATVAEILRSQGYTLETDIAPDSLTTTDFIACMPPKMVGGYYNYNVRFWNHLRWSVGYDNRTTVSYIDKKVSTGTTDTTGRSEYLSAIYPPMSKPVVWALQDATYKVEERYLCTGNIGSDPSATTQIQRTIRVVDSSGNELDAIIRDADVDATPAWQTRSITHTVELKKGQGVSIETTTYTRAATPTNPVVTPEFIVTLESNTHADEDDETVLNRDTQIGSTLDLLASTGFATVLDLFKVFIQLYGLTVEVNSDTRTVRAYTFNYLRSKKESGDVVDWSAAVALTKDERRVFKIGEYAQTNSIKLKENPNDFNYTDVAQFSVDNKTLAEEKDLFTIALESGRNTTQRNMSVANYPLFKRDEGNTRSYVGDCGPHIVRVKKSGSIAVQLEQGTLGSKTVTLNPAIHIPLRDHIDVYYNTLMYIILKDARAVTIPMNLSVLDIYGLDFFKPVWIDYYGAYFYILKVNNFIAGRLATCDLAKL